MGNIRTGNSYAPNVGTPFNPPPVIPSDVGAGLFQGVSALASGVSSLGAKVQAEKDKEGDFAANTAYIGAATDAQQKLQDAQNAAPPDPQNFPKTVNDSFTADHAALVSSLVSSGKITPDQANDLTVRLDGLRQNINAQAISFQDTQHKSFITGQVTQNTGKIGQSVFADPTQLPGALAELKTMTDSIPQIDQATRDKIYSDNAAQLTILAGQAYAQKNPGAVISALTASPKPEGGVQTALPDSVGNVIDAAATSSGIPTATFRAGALIESSGDPSSNKGSSTPYKGLYQLTQQEFDANGGGDIYNAADNAAAAAKIWATNSRLFQAQFGRPPAPVELYLMHQQGVGGLFAHLQNPSGIAWQNMRGTGEGQDIASGKEKYNGQTGPAAADAWAKSAVWGNVPDDVKDQFPGGVGALTSGQLLQIWEKKVAAKGGGGGTGDPVLDQLSGTQQLQVLGIAQSQQNQNQTGARAALGVDISNATAAFQTGGSYNGPSITPDRFNSAYGPITGPQEYAKYLGDQQQGQFISGAATDSEAAIDQKLSALRPTDTNSPTFGVDSASFSNLQTAAAGLVQKRKDDPVGYAETYFPAVKQAYQDMTADGAGINEQQNYFAHLNAAYDTLGLAPADRKPFSADVIGSMKQAWTSQTPAQEVQSLASLRLQTGPLFTNALTQLGITGQYKEAYIAGAVDQDPQSALTFSDALEGLKKMQDSSMAPPPTQVDAAFQSAIDYKTLGKLPPDSARAMKELAVGLYVQQGGDPSKIDPNDPVYKSAVRQIVGGSATDPNTGVVDMHQGRAQYSTILPPNITKDQFQGFINNANTNTYSQISSNGGLPQYANGEVASAQDIQREGTFVRVGSNQYVIYMGSDGAPLQQAGQPTAANPYGFYIANLDESTVRNLSTQPAARPEPGPLASQSNPGPKTPTLLPDNAKINPADLKALSDYAAKVAPSNISSETPDQQSMTHQAPGAPPAPGTQGSIPLPVQPQVPAPTPPPPKLPTNPPPAQLQPIPGAEAQKWPSYQGMIGLNLTPEEENLYQFHLNNMVSGKFVKNKDGTASTLLQITWGHNGVFYNLPTVWDGKVQTTAESIKRAAAIGLQYWPSYPTEEAADARYEQMHAFLEKDINDTGLPSQVPGRTSPTDKPKGK